MRSFVPAPIRVGAASGGNFQKSNGAGAERAEIQKMNIGIEQKQRLIIVHTISFKEVT
jgi:hypothetical protein